MNEYTLPADRIVDVHMFYVQTLREVIQRRLNVISEDDPEWDVLTTHAYIVDKTYMALTQLEKGRNS
jgi:hypothetical protein